MVGNWPPLLPSCPSATMPPSAGIVVVVVVVVVVKVKGPNIALNERTHLTATERHLSYGITQCYLPPDRGERIPP